VKAHAPDAGPLRGPVGGAEAAQTRQIAHRTRESVGSPIQKGGLVITVRLLVSRMTCLVAVATAALALPAPAHAFTRSDRLLPMADGVSLATTFYAPPGSAPAGGWPGILLLHGLGATRASMNEIAEQFLAPQGYAVLTVDARGHGESGGVSTLSGAREVADYATALQYLRLRPGVSDSRVGALGFSLGGGSVWKLLTAPGARLAAAVPITTWTSLFDALLPQGFAKAGLVTYLRSQLADERWDPTFRTLADDALLGRNLPQIQQFAVQRSVRTDLGRIRTPVFMIQGRRDFAFDFDHALGALGLLRGPRRLYLGGLGHAPAPNPTAERAHYLTQARLWFDRFLKGQLNGIDTRPRIELGPDPWTGRTAELARQPTRRTLRLRWAGRLTIDGTGKLVRTAAPTRRLNETFGGGLVSVYASSTTKWPHLVAVVSAITPRGQEIVVSAGGAQTPALSASSKVITIRLASQATTIPRGSRLRLTIAGTSTAQHAENVLYPLPVPSTARVTLGAARVVLPVLARPVSRAA
jgi:predicted acyl esterase